VNYRPRHYAARPALPLDAALVLVLAVLCWAIVAGATL
jgi:hypothetical protein